MVEAKDAAESKWRTNLIWAVMSFVGGIIVSQLFGYFLGDWSDWRKEKDTEGRDSQTRIVRLETQAPSLVDAIARVEKQQAELKAEVKEGFEKLESKLDRFMAVANVIGNVASGLGLFVRQDQTVWIVEDRIKSVQLMRESMHAKAVQ